MRINRAADDAAGLAISESLRSQANGAAQAQRNVQDGVSLLQTAEGALAETHAMLQRVRTLAVQAANDTLSDEDRRLVQVEVTQLVRSITRNAERTEFNSMPVIDGTFRDRMLQIGANAGAVMEVGIANMDGKSLGIERPFGSAPKAHQLLEGTDDLPPDPNVLPLHPDGSVHARTRAENISVPDYLHLRDTGGATFDPELDGWAKVMVDVIDADGNVTGQAWHGQWSKDADGDPDTPPILSYDPPDPYDAPQVYLHGDPRHGGLRSHYRDTWDDTVAHMTKADADHQVLSNPGRHPYDWHVGQAPAMIALKPPENEPNTRGTIPDGVYRIDNDVVHDRDGKQVGRYDDATFTLSFGDETWAVFDKSLYTEDWHRPELRHGQVTITNVIQVTSQDLASSAIGAIDDAIAIVSDQRAALGAQQNRLEHTMANLGVTEENLRAAESRIRDADMAKEMAELSRGQVLQQAATAMLAQANQAPQSVLKLLG